MKFSLPQAIEILERTPSVLSQLLSNLSSPWTSNNEGGETWSPYDVLGHLIHGEKTDWITRAEIIISDSGDKKFESFDRFAQFESSKSKNLIQLLEEFKDARSKSIARLKQLNITDEQLTRTGIHPKFGEVTLSQLLSTWVVHDLDHISQITRVMAKQYKEAVGPLVEYLKILRQE